MKQCFVLTSQFFLRGFESVCHALTPIYISTNYVIIITVGKQVMESRHSEMF